MSAELGPLSSQPAPDYLRQLSRLMALVDRAMGDEGIAADLRDRVRSRVLYGTPEPGEPADWADPPLPWDLAVVEMLGEAAPACVRERPSWTAGA